MPYRPPSIIRDMRPIDLDFTLLETTGNITLSETQRRKIFTATHSYLFEKEANATLPKDRDAQRYFEAVAKTCHKLSNLFRQSDLIWELYPIEARQYVGSPISPEELANQLDLLGERAEEATEKFKETKRGRPRESFLDEFIVSLLDIYSEAGGDPSGCVQDRTIEDGYRGPLFRFIVEVFVQVDPAREAIAYLGRRVCELGAAH